MKVLSFAFDIVTKRQRLRWLLIVSGLWLLTGFVLQADPLTELDAAKARWQAAGITDYRIAVTFERPYASCQQNFDVRGAEISRKHKDSCSVGGAITSKPGMVWPTVNNLFARIEDGLKNPQCGPNGCVCDGPVEMTVTYDPERGYPLEIVYTLRQDLRRRDIQYWLAMLDGTLANCPPVTYIGQTIRVTSLETLAPLVEALTEEATKEPHIDEGAAAKPETTPAP